MKLRDLIPSDDQLTVIQGVERDLRRRRRNSLWGAILAVAGGVLNIVLAIFDEDYLRRVGDLWRGLVAGDPRQIVDALGSPEVIALLLVVAAVSTFLLLRWTRFLLKESEEPFRYTFWIDAFERDGEEEDADDGVKVAGADRIRRLLHHDLRERITKRIPRFSLLDPSDEGVRIDDPEALSSHIRITGTWVVRESKDGGHQIQLMSRIRIGPPGSPETLAHPLRLPLEGPPAGPGSKEDGTGGEARDDDADRGEARLTLDQYEQLVERAYSQVATEIYRRLEQDLKGKIELFPTNYLRAVALYNEAEDLARSNTVDAYDRAVGLYREARRRLRIANVEPLSRILIRSPLLWRTQVRYEHFWARIQIGYAKCLIYRRLISALAGQRQKPLFEIPGELDDVLGRMARLHQQFHGRSWKLGGSGARRWSLQAAHVANPRGLVDVILRAGRGEGLSDPVSAAAWESMDEAARRRLAAWDGDSLSPPPDLLDALNGLIRGPRSLRRIPGLAESVASAEARALFKWDRIPAVRTRLNRLILDEIYGEFLESRVTYRLGTVMSFLTFPRDTWWRKILVRPSFELFKQQTDILFEAHVVAALAYHYLGAIRRAREQLENAEAVAPLLTDRSPLYKLAAAEIETDLSKEITLFRQALALDPDFEIARFRLAQKLEVQFRLEDTLTPERADRVVGEYRKVLRINPGNVAALTALGYLHWLTYDPREPGGAERLARARQHFVDILDLTEIVRHRSEGEANYGLARIRAEEGDLTRSHELFVQARGADPAVGAHSKKRAFLASASALGTMKQYDYIGPKILQRYRDLERRVRQHVSKASGPIAEMVHCFVLNDLGNALYQHFLRTGDRRALDEAIERYSRAVDGTGEHDGISYFNLHHAHLSRFNRNGDPKDREASRKRLAEAEKHAPEWPSGVLSLAESRLTEAFEQREKARKKAPPAATQTPRERGGTGPTLSSVQEGLLDTGEITIGAGGPVSSGSPTAPAGSHPGSAPLQTEGGQSLERAERDLKLARDRAEEIVARTKLAAVQKGLNFTADGQGIDLLLESRLELGRLDEDDVAALRLWAHVLKTYAMSEQAPPERLWKTYCVCRYIDQRFYFDNFEINDLVKGLVEFVEESRDDGAGSGLTAEMCHGLGWAKLRSQGVRRDNVKSWIEADPVHYAALTWTDVFDFPERLPLHQRAVTLSPDPLRAPPLHLLGDVHQQASNFVEAARCYVDATRHDDEDPVVWSNLARCRVVLEEWDAAEDACTHAVQLDPENAAYRNLLGNVHHGKGEFEVAVRCYKKAITLIDDDPVVWSNLGNTRQSLEQWDEAVTAYERAIELDPENAGYRNLLGNVHHARSEYEAAIECYEEAIAREADLPVYWSNLAGSNRELERWDDARAAYRRAIQLDPENAGYRNFLGNVYHAMGDYASAIDRYREAIDLQDDEPVYWSNLAGSNRELERWDDARAAYERAIELDPENADLKVHLGNVLYWSGAFEASIEPYLDAIALDPANVVYRTNLGNAYVKLERWDEAVEAYERAIELDPENAGTRNLMGNAYHASGEFARAIECYQDAIGIDPTASVYHTNMGNSRFNLERWDDAVEAYERAIELDPANAMTWNLLGNAYHAAGEFARAVEAYEEAIRHEENDPVFWSNLAGSNRALERWDAAEKAFERSAELQRR